MTDLVDFLAGIGVNTHVDATSTGYGDVALLQASLAYLGLSLIRDHAYDVDIAAYRTLAGAGVKFDLILDDDPKAELDDMTPVFASIRYLEGPNEVDYQPILTNGIADPVLAAVAEQASVAAALAATPALLGTPLLGPSLASPDSDADFAAALADATVGNLHSYAAYGASPGAVIAADLATLSALSTRPVAVTETGYYTMPTDDSGVDESVQARLTLDTLFDTASLGIAPTLLYELFDEADDPGNTDGELHYGLFHADGSPKLVATALHNLTTILNAANATPSSALPTGIGVEIDAENPPETARTLTLTGNAGTTVAAIWAEPPIWDPVTHTEVAPPETSTRVDLGSTIGSVLVFDPLLGTDPIARYADISTLTLVLTDHPLLLQLSAAAAVVTPPAATAPPVTTPPVITPPVTTPPVTIPPPAPDQPVVTPISETPASSTASTSLPTTTTPVTTSPPAPDEAVIATSPQTPQPLAAITPPPIGVYRFFETTNGTHFFTADAAEAQSIQQTRPDLTFEGVGLRSISADASDPAAAPVYRFFDSVSGTQFLTASASERDNVIATRPDLRYEPASRFYEHATAQPGDAPVYRFFDSVHGTHFYTDNATERATILNTRADLVAEGVGFYEPG